MSRSACKHFNGIFGKPICAQGIQLIAKVGPRKTEGWMKRLPCLAMNDAPAFICDHFDLKPPPSPEDEAGLRARIAAVGTALKAIKAIPGPSGTIECPVCRGTLDWTRSSYNDHVHGRCQKEGCVTWMQ